MPRARSQSPALFPERRLEADLCWTECALRPRRCRVPARLRPEDSAAIRTAVRLPTLRARTRQSSAGGSPMSGKSVLISVVTSDRSAGRYPDDVDPAAEPSRADLDLMAHVKAGRQRADVQRNRTARHARHRPGAAGHRRWEAPYGASAPTPRASKRRSVASSVTACGMPRSKRETNDGDRPARSARRRCDQPRAVRAATTARTTVALRSTGEGAARLTHPFYVRSA